MTENIKSPLPRYRIAEGGSEDTGWYGIEVEDEGGEFVRFADVQRMFTREDVEWLNEQWLGTISTMPDLEPHPKDDIRHKAWERRQRTFRIARSLASRIAALLPPRE